jgi:hypothetical protein
MSLRNIVQGARDVFTIVFRGDIARYSRPSSAHSVAPIQALIWINASHWHFGGLLYPHCIGRSANAGHWILIVESEVSSFASHLQEAIERTGAESLVVRAPYSADGVKSIKRFKFSPAVINVQHPAE